VLRLVCLHLGVLVHRDSWWFPDLTAPALPWLYAVQARHPAIGRMAVVAAAFAVPAGDFLIAYVRQG
jgi:hypothetical protein